MPRPVPLCAILALTSALTACNTLPLPAVLPMEETRASAFEHIEAKGSPAIQFVHVPADALTSQSAREPLPASLAKTPVSVRFPAGPGTLADLVTALDAQKIQILFRWDNPENEALLERRLPFTRYNGDFEGLMKALRSGLGLAYWWENGSVQISDMDRYSVSLPQNKDVLSTVTKEIETLGAKEVLSSLRGGTIIYSASPRVQDETIGPYLDRLVRNLSMVTLQVAIVSVAVTDNSAAGFDWSAFSAKFDSRRNSLSNLTNPPTAGDMTGGVGGGAGGGSGAGDGGGNGGGAGQIGDGGDTGPAVADDIGTIIDLTARGLTFGRTSLGDMFGTYGALSVGSAIAFLSEFGSTKVSQNVELRTLSGSDVSLRSGQEVPYVSGLGTTTTGENMNNNVETSTVQTGITLGMTPHFDWGTSTVTVDVDLELKSVLEFIEINAGNEVGSFTQPLTQDQSLTDIVRMAAGQTVVIGGLQYDSEDYKGNDPVFLREDASLRSKWGKNARDVSRNALFIILRPSVTVFAPIGAPTATPGRAE